MTVISLAHLNIVRSRSSAHKDLSTKENKSRKILAMFLICLIAFIGFFYIAQANGATSKSYKIRELKKNIREIEDKNRGLQVGISNLKSINFLQSKSEAFDMVKAEDINYVILSSTNVAAK